MKPKPQFDRRSFMAFSAAGLLGGCKVAEQLGGMGTGQPAGPPVAPGISGTPNVLIVLSDSLRADRLGCLGQSMPLTPNLDSLASRSLVFERCYSAATWTLPATMSIMTGALPVEHQVTAPEWSTIGKAKGGHQVLSERYGTMGEDFSALGYRTGYFSANSNSHMRYGHARGCEHFSYQPELNDPEAHVEECIQWLEQDKDRPFWGFLHMVNPHAPYQPLEEDFHSLYGKDISAILKTLPDDERIQKHHLIAYKGAEDSETLPSVEELLAMPPEVGQFFFQLYNSEVVGVDRAVGRLVKHLSSTPGLENTILCVISDHGESFGEDNTFYHSSSLHQSQTRVPLIISLPGMTGGQQVPWSMSLCDLRATLLRLLGVEDVDPERGEALLSARGHLLCNNHRMVHSTLDLTSADLQIWRHSILQGDQKIVYEGKLKPMKYYDLQQDPREETGVLKDAVTNTQVFQPLLDEYRKMRSLWLRPPSRKAPTWQAMESFDAEVLENLGYL